MRRLLAAFAVAIVLPLLGCDITLPGGTIHGTYTLQTVDGGMLPWLAVQVGSDRVEIASGQVTLNEDGTYEDVLIYTVTENGAVLSDTERYEGTFTKSAVGAILRPAGGEPYTAAIVGSKMTQEFGGNQYVYRK